MVVVAPIVRTLIARSLRLVIGRAARVVPRRLRMRYAWRMSRLLQPVIAPALRKYRSLRLINSDRALSLGYVVRAMMDHGCEFDAPVRVHGGELIPTGAALFAGGHLYLGIAGLRWLWDRGLPLHLVRMSPDEQCILGTRVPARVIAQDRLLFIRMRSAFRRGESVAALLDHYETGELAIHPEAFAVALACGAPVVFMAAEVSGDEAIDFYLELPKGRDAKEIAQELQQFLLRHAQA